MLWRLSVQRPSSGLQGQGQAGEAFRGTFDLVLERVNRAGTSGGCKEEHARGRR